MDILIRGKNDARKMNNVYVKNLPKDFTLENLNEMFSIFGEIKSSVVVNDEKKGVFGFVCYGSPEEAAKAMETLNNKEKLIEDAPLYVGIAMRKEERVEKLQRQFLERKLLSQKMTVFARASEEFEQSSINLGEAILADLHKIFAWDYTPHGIIVRPDKKSAFITMPNRSDAETFAKQFCERFSSNAKKLITYSLYKSKSERNKNLEMLKKMTPSNSGFYNTYNNFVPLQNPQVPVQMRNSGRIIIKNK